jgi:hypothetical protein
MKPRWFRRNLQAALQVLPVTVLTVTCKTCKTNPSTTLVLEEAGKLVALEIKASSQVTTSDATEIRALSSLFRRGPL